MIKILLLCVLCVGLGACSVGVKKQVTRKSVTTSGGQPGQLTIPTTGTTRDQPRGHIKFVKPPETPNLDTGAPKLPADVPTTGYQIQPSAKPGDVPKPD